MNVLDRLEALAEKATERPWRTDASAPTGSWPYQIETPEGGLVVHQVEGTADADLIVAAVNVLPDLLAVARAATGLQVDLDDCDTDEVTRTEREILDALEPLLREAAP